MKYLVLMMTLAFVGSGQPPAKSEHYMQFVTQAGAFPSDVMKPDKAGPHPPVPIGLNAPDCRILPFYSNTWQQVANSQYACYPWATTATSPSVSAYLARWNFQVNFWAPCNAQVVGEGEEPDSNICTFTQTNGFQYISYCTDTQVVTWQSYTGTAVNPTSGNLEPAAIVTAEAYSPILEEVTMSGTMAFFWNGAPVLTCDPGSCTAPCN